MSLKSVAVTALKFAPKVYDAVVGFLPAGWQSVASTARHAIVAAAGVALSVTAAAQALPLPASVQAVVAVVSGVATVITTYWATKSLP